MTEDSAGKQSETAGIRCATTYEDTVLKPRYDAVKRLFWFYITRADYAHAVMMAEQGLLSREESKQILTALRRLEQEIDQSLLSESAETFRSGKDFISDTKKYLLSLLPEGVGEKLYLFRNNNELLHTIFRIALKDRLSILIGNLLSTLDGVLVCAKRDAAIAVPQDSSGISNNPISWGNYLSGIAELLLKDCERLFLVLRNIDTCPLDIGSGIDRGIRFDRVRLAELLGFLQLQDNTLSSALMDDCYLATHEALQQLFFNITKIAEDLLQRVQSRTPHIWYPEKCEPITDILEELRLLALMTSHDAAAFIQSIQTLPVSKQKNIYFSLHMKGYQVFDSGIRILKLFDSMSRALKGDERAFLRKIDREGLVLTELNEHLIREYQVSADSVHSIMKQLAHYLSENRLPATLLPFSVFQTVFQEKIGSAPDMGEDTFKKLLSPYTFLNSHGIANHFFTAMEPILGRYEKQSFDLRIQLDSFMNRAQHADQILAKAVDDIISLE